MMRPVLALAALAAGLAAPALAQAPPQMSAFYAACLASGGAPGIYAVAGSDTTTLVRGLLQPRQVSITIAPDATNALVIVSARSLNTALPNLNLGPGQSVTLQATEVTTRHNFKRAEYCVRFG